MGVKLEVVPGVKRLGALGKSAGGALGKSMKSLRTLTGLPPSASATLDVTDVTDDDGVPDNSWAMPVARRLVAEETRARDAHIAALQAELATAQSEAKEQTLMRANTERQIKQLIAPPGNRRAAAAGAAKRQTSTFLGVDTSAHALWSPEVSPENSLVRGPSRTSSLPRAVAAR